jgi:hypothetical protein
VDLCAQLKNELAAPIYTIDTRAKGKNPNLDPSIEEMKRGINRLHRTLNNYRTKGIIE